MKRNWNTVYSSRNSITNKKNIMKMLLFCGFSFIKISLYILPFIYQVPYICLSVCAYWIHVYINFANWNQIGIWPLVHGIPSRFIWNFKPCFLRIELYCPINLSNSWHLKHTIRNDESQIDSWSFPKKIICSLWVQGPNQQNEHM